MSQYYELCNDAGYIAQQREHIQKKRETDALKDAVIFQELGYKLSKYQYHAAPEYSVIHDVYVKHDTNGYQFAIKDSFGQMNVILQNQQKLVPKYAVGRGQIYLCNNVFSY